MTINIANCIAIIAGELRKEDEEQWLEMEVIASPCVMARDGYPQVPKKH